MGILYPDNPHDPQYYSPDCYPGQISTRAPPPYRYSAKSLNHYFEQLPAKPPPVYTSRETDRHPRSSPHRDPEKRRRRRRSSVSPSKEKRKMSYQAYRPYEPLENPSYDGGHERSYSGSRYYQRQESPSPERGITPEPPRSSTPRGVPRARYYDQQDRSSPFVDPEPAIQSHVRQPSAYAEADYYKHTTVSPHDEAEYYKSRTLPRGNPAKRKRRFCAWGEWSRTRKLVVVGAIIVLIIIIAIAIAVPVSIAENKYDYTPSSAQVNNTEAFTTGGGSHNDPSNVQDGIGAGKDEYTYYQGTWNNFPAASAWVSFEDMWNANQNKLQNACKWLDAGPDNTPTQIQQIYDAIQNRATSSLVDHRFIFAVILQESSGCVHIGQTKSSTGVTNPGLMQSHDGHEFSSAHSNVSIVAMVQDGTQGTDSVAGYGLVQNLNNYGNAYSAARGYNSGYVPKDGNLSEAAGATACYVSDIANRLTGWVAADSKCPGDTS